MSPTVDRVVVAIAAVLPSIQVMFVPFRLLLTESMTNLDTNGMSSPHSEILEKVRVEVFTTLIISFNAVDEISGTGST